MKKIISIFVLIFAFVLTASAQKTYAIITGVSNYEGTSNDLYQSTKDAKNIANLYKSKGATVILLTSKYATRDNIIGEIRKLSKTVKSNDKVIFFYSGHGMENTICTYTSSGKQMLTYADFFKELDQCPANDIVCYIDACFSGTAVKSMGNKSKYTLFLSSREDEVSGESGLIGAGLMTNAIIKGLRGKADANNDKKVTSMELFKYVHADVKLHKQSQHPQLVTMQSKYDNILMAW